MQYEYWEVLELGCLEAYALKVLREHSLPGLTLGTYDTL